MENDDMLKKRLEELYARSSSRACYTHSDFLSLSGQSLVDRTALSSGECVLCGGHDGAERRIAFFGSEKTCGYKQAPPIACVKIEPKGAAFADDLTHRDFLGALMSLGIKREALGDIVVRNNCGYLFCLDTIASYITENLTKSKHTALACTEIPMPEFESQLPDETTITIASQRLDALIAAVFKLSRSAAQAQISAGLVFIDGREEQSGSFTPEDGVIISVRGKGRFLFEGILRQTKKGRLCARVRIY